MPKPKLILFFTILTLVLIQTLTVFAGTKHKNKVKGAVYVCTVKTYQSATLEVSLKGSKNGEEAETTLGTVNFSGLELNGTLGDKATSDKGAIASWTSDSVYEIKSTEPAMAGKNKESYPMVRFNVEDISKYDTVKLTMKDEYTERTKVLRESTPANIFKIGLRQITDGTMDEIPDDTINVEVGDPVTLAVKITPDEAATVLVNKVEWYKAVFSHATSRESVEAYSNFELIDTGGNTMQYTANIYNDNSDVGIFARVYFNTADNYLDGADMDKQGLKDHYLDTKIAILRTGEQHVKYIIDTYEAKVGTTLPTTAFPTSSKKLYSVPLGFRLETADPSAISSISDIKDSYTSYSINSWTGEAKVGYTPAVRKCKVTLAGKQVDAEIWVVPKAALTATYDMSAEDTLGDFWNKEHFTVKFEGKTLDSSEFYITPETVQPTSKVTITHVDTGISCECSVKYQRLIVDAGDTDQDIVRIEVVLNDEDEGGTDSSGSSKVKFINRTALNSGEDAVLNMLYGINIVAVKRGEEYDFYTVPGKLGDAPYQKYLKDYPKINRKDIHDVKILYEEHDGILYVHYYLAQTETTVSYTIKEDAD